MNFLNWQKENPGRSFDEFFYTFMNSGVLPDYVDSFATTAVDNSENYVTYMRIESDRDYQGSIWGRSGKVLTTFSVNLFCERELQCIDLSDFFEDFINSSAVQHQPGIISADISNVSGISTYNNKYLINVIVTFVTNKGE